MAKFLITRIRHVVEGITLDAGSADEAVEKSKKTKRAAWSHIDSKRRKSYKAEKVVHS